MSQDHGVNSVAHQLILNLNCLGFDLKSVVLDKVPSQGLPQRYNDFTLCEDMFSARNSAVVEIVLYFVFENMPWEGVAEVLPCTSGVPLNQMDTIKKRYVDNATHHFSELKNSFPCTEVDQLTSFKKSATSLLDLLKHLLPPDLGHTRRVLTESGPRMAYVIYRLTSYILQHQALGVIDPLKVTGGIDTPARRNVLKSLAVRESFKFQSIAERYLEASDKVKTVGGELTRDYEVASSRVNAARKRALMKQRKNSAVEDDGGGGGDASERLEKRKHLVETIKELHLGRDPVVKGFDLTAEGLQKTWVDAGGAGDLFDDAKPDIREVIKNWVGYLDSLQAGIFKDKVSTANRKLSVKQPVRQPLTAIADLTSACNAQRAPLATILEKTQSQAHSVTARLQPRLTTSLAQLQRQLASNPLNLLLTESRNGSPSPLPATAVPQPTPMVRKEGSPDTWLVSAGEYVD